MTRRKVLALLCVPVAAVVVVGLWVPRPWRQRRPNLLLITVETLRRDHCSLYGYERDTTPFLRELAKESVVFDNAWSHSSWTYPSMACVLSGRMPEETGVWHAACQPRIEILPWLADLRDLGYLPFACTTNGFVEQLVTPSERHMAKWWRFYQKPADRLFSRLAPSLTMKDAEPWFAFCHLFDPHSPYSAPGVIRDIFAAGAADRLAAVEELTPKVLESYVPLGQMEREYVEGRYDGEVWYVDSELERIVNRLRKYGVWNNTCLILTADHGEAFGERGEWGHGHGPHRDQTAVPFLVRLPGGHHGGTRTDALVGGIDVLPTLLTQAGVAVPEDLPGVNVVSLLDDPRPERVLEQHVTTLEWRDKEHVAYQLIARWRGSICGQDHSAREVPLGQDQAGPQRAKDEHVLARLHDLGYL